MIHHRRLHPPPPPPCAAISSAAAPHSTAAATMPNPNKRRRRPAGTPDPDAEVVALSPKTLMESDRYVCEICNQGFQRDQNLQMHRRRHKVPWKLLRRTCPAAATPSDSAASNGNEILKAENTSSNSGAAAARKRVYVCPEPTCLHHEASHALGDLVGIKKHYRRKHSRVRQWECEKCGKAYAVQSDYKAHIKTCGTRGHCCDCGRVFSRVESFIEHQDACEHAGTTSSKRAAGPSTSAPSPPHNPLILIHKTNIHDDHTISKTNPTTIHNRDDKFNRPDNINNGNNLIAPNAKPYDHRSFHTNNHHHFTNKNNSINVDGNYADRNDKYTKPNGSNANYHSVRLSYGRAAEAVVSSPDPNIHHLFNSLIMYNHNNPSRNQVNSSPNQANPSPTHVNPSPNQVDPCSNHNSTVKNLKFNLNHSYSYNLNLNHAHAMDSSHHQDLLLNTNTMKTPSPTKYIANDDRHPTNALNIFSIKSNSENTETALNGNAIHHNDKLLNHGIVTNAYSTPHKSPLNHHNGLDDRFVNHDNIRIGKQVINIRDEERMTMSKAKSPNNTATINSMTTLLKLSIGSFVCDKDHIGGAVCETDGGLGLVDDEDDADQDSTIEKTEVINMPEMVAKESMISTNPCEERLVKEAENEIQRARNAAESAWKEAREEMEKARKMKEDYAHLIRTLVSNSTNTKNHTMISYNHSYGHDLNNVININDDDDDGKCSSSDGISFSIVSCPTCNHSQIAYKRVDHHQNQEQEQDKQKKDYNGNHQQQQLKKRKPKSVQGRSIIDINI